MVKLNIFPRSSYNVHLDTLLWGFLEPNDSNRVFPNASRKTNTKLITSTNPTGANSTMNQSEFLCNNVQVPQSVRKMARTWCDCF